MVKTAVAKKTRTPVEEFPERLFIEMKEPNIDDIAVTLFAKKCLHKTQYDLESVAKEAYAAAEAFMKVYKSRSQER